MKVMAEISITDATRECTLNDAFIRSFRDTGDGDYIVARLAYRAQLVPQFHWSSLQAIEKYLKCILTLNRVEAKTGHNPSETLGRIRRKVNLQLRLSKMTEEFIEHIDTFGKFRYLETPYHTRGYALVELDRAVWEIRRYCQTLDFSRILETTEAEKRRNLELAVIENARKLPPKKFSLFGGFLEKVIREKNHPARRSLIWKNFYFGLRERNRVSLAPVCTAVNSPLSLDPTLLDDMIKYVHLPDEVKRAYRQNVKDVSLDSGHH
jgi:hypothetical protein